MCKHTRPIKLILIFSHSYVIADSFYACLAPPIVVGVLLTCQSVDPEYKTTAFFQMYFQEKNIVLYSGQYGNL